MATPSLNPPSNFHLSLDMNAAQPFNTAPMETEAPFLSPELPAGYRRLKAGEKRPKGYLFRCRLAIEGNGWTHGGQALIGTPITENNLEHLEFAGPTK